MKRLLLVAAGMMAVGFTSCGDGAGDTTTSDTSSATNTVAPAANGQSNAETPNVGTVSDSTGGTRVPGEDTGAIHQNTSTPGQLPQ
jgi:hypothetical protein